MTKNNVIEKNVEILEGGTLGVDLVKIEEKKYIRFCIEHDSLPNGGTWIVLDKEGSIAHMNQITKFINMMSET